MVTFANNIDQLKQMLQASISDLEAVQLSPGGWPNAINLASGVIASGKLRDSTQSVVQSMIDTITDLSAATRKLAADFTKAEDLNNLSATDLAKYLASVNGDLSSLGTGSNSSGTGA
jgi:UDP-3-O-acyl-N-acetylglucosamine deacetylase